jgi:hypothetical protein
VSGELARGQQVVLTLTIESPKAMSVGVGAGFYDQDSNDQSTGFGDIDSHQLAAGSNVVSRQFLVPVSVPAGAYELDAELWPPNEVGHDGVDTLAETACATVRLR